MAHALLLCCTTHERREHLIGSLLSKNGSINANFAACLPCFIVYKEKNNLVLIPVLYSSTQSPRFSLNVVKFDVIILSSY